MYSNLYIVTNLYIVRKSSYFQFLYNFGKLILFSALLIFFSFKTCCLLAKVYCCEQDSSPPYSHLIPGRDKS